MKSGTLDFERGDGVKSTKRAGPKIYRLGLEIKLVKRTLLRIERAVSNNLGPSCPCTVLIWSNSGEN